MRRNAVLIGALLLILAAIGFVAWRGVSITTRVAAPLDISHELMASLRVVGREMAAQSSWLKVVGKPVATMEDARRAIADKEVDFAILRSDQPMPSGTGVIAILRK